MLMQTHGHALLCPIDVALLPSGIRREVSVADLCTEFKCNAIKTTARQTLEAYKRQFWASLDEGRRQDADFSRWVLLYRLPCFMSG